MNNLTFADLYAMKLYLEEDNKTYTESLQIANKVDVPDIKASISYNEHRLDILEREIWHRIISEIQD